MYDMIPVSEAVHVTEKRPNGTRWVDINKVDDESNNHRSRWVAQEIRMDKGQWELFAGTPPLDAVRYIISTCASTLGNQVMSNDIRRAYVFADVRKPIFVELPTAAKQGDNPNVCARLRKSPHGTLDAASNWSEWCTNILVEHGFVRGASNPCLVFHAARNLFTLVHRDDFLSTSSADNLKWLNEMQTTSRDGRERKRGGTRSDQADGGGPATEQSSTQTGPSGGTTRLTGGTKRINTGTETEQPKHTEDTTADRDTQTESKPTRQRPSTTSKRAEDWSERKTAADRPAGRQSGRRRRSQPDGATRQSSRAQTARTRGKHGAGHWPMRITSESSGAGWAN